MLGIGNLLGSVFGVVGSALNGVVGGLRNIGVSLVGGVGTLLDATVIGLGDVITTAAGTLANGLSGVAGTLTNWAGGVVETAAAFLNNGFIDIVRVFSPEVAEEMPRIETPYGEFFENIGNVVGPVIENIGGAFEGVGSGINLDTEPVTLSADFSPLVLSAAPAAFSASPAPLAVSEVAPAIAVLSAESADIQAVPAASGVATVSSDLPNELLAGEGIVVAEPAAAVEAEIDVAEFLDGGAVAADDVAFDNSFVQGSSDLYDSASLVGVIV